MRWVLDIFGCALFVSTCVGHSDGAHPTPTAQPNPVVGGVRPWAESRRGQAAPQQNDAPHLQVVDVQPLGADLPDADVAAVKEALEAFYDVKVELLARVPLPPGSYYAPRNRYRADALLDFLGQRKQPDAFRILGLTNADISTTKGKIYDWGVLGLANLSGDACVISSFRATKGTKTAAEARIRLAKVAVHEVGHTFGLPHCNNAGCLMEDAEGTVSTTDQEYDLCTDCRSKLMNKGFLQLGSGQHIPWPNPR